MLAFTIIDEIYQSEERMKKTHEDARDKAEKMRNLLLAR